MNDCSQKESWKEERARILKNARTIVFKVGSAVITNEQGLDRNRMQHLADQIACLWDALPQRRVVLVTSAAVAAGKTLLRAMKKTVEFQGLSARQAVAAIGQSQLMQAWDSAFRLSNHLTAQVLLSREDLQARQHFLNIRNTFAELLDWNVLPIVNENDTVSVQELTFGDNDSLASLLVNLVNADLCVNITSAEGVRARDPQKDPDSPLLDHIDDIAGIDIPTMCGSKTNVGTGGMYSKLRSARRTAQIGIPTLILSGKKEKSLLEAFSENSTLGTWIKPSQKTISRRKYWLAYKRNPEGTLVIDEGACKALLHEGRSLLPGGIRSVEGSFQKGALLRIVKDEQELGVGLSNYSSQEINEIMGLKRHEVAARLGDAHYPDVIHRDNLILNAVI